MDYKDYYSTLGLKKDASQDDIQKAYRKLARKFHPDVNKDSQAEVKFKEIGEAYEVLKDPDKRKKYDQFGSAWTRSQQGGGAPPGWEGMPFDFDGFDFGGGGGGFQGGGAEGFSSFFEMLFGGGGPAGRRARGANGPAGFGGAGGVGGMGGRGRGRGGDTEATIQLSLEEAVRGGSREIALSDPSTGQRKTVSVRIPEGVRAGQKIRLAGKGQPSFDGSPAGDLLLKIEILPDPRFRVEGSDIYTTVPVTPWEAALGSEAEVETPTGRLRVRIPAGSSSGRKIRLRERGLSAGGGIKGDLFAEIRIMVPEQLSDRERALFEELAEASEFRARA
ncbi:MAG TPA: DnaJ C-terminal domain-containing protein [Thermoanaerobaculia bacterium]|nr:DnaJ C-terminal domain-containing protein [Thermoanaerobaculia bacterium]